MDSLTQIVLGAACGEAVLGKKIGNKAILFGAIGGTIPDLDVFTGRLLYSNEIDILSSHRGFSHSILFSIMGAFVFGIFFYWLYDRGKRINTTLQKDWIWLFFWALFTHIILDSFTPYGTQLFLPFSNYRVAFNNISVADPFYTVPFLLCLIVLMFFNRKKKIRRNWLKAGLIISSSYMLFTIVNKINMNRKFERSLESSQQDYTRFRVQPSILNNLLWYGIAESSSGYSVSYYSLLDKENDFINWVDLPKNHYLLPIDDQDIKTLGWFSDGYFNILPTENPEEFRYNDLRYPLLNGNDANSSVFSFTIFKDNDRWNIKPFIGKPPSSDDFNAFIERIKGN